MNEITKVFLENEMDLILANKQSMKLAELTGLTLAMQTTFATAVSEVARNAIERSKDACLKLYTSKKEDKEKYLIAVISDDAGRLTAKQEEGYRYAKKLVSNISTTTTSQGTEIELRFRIISPIRLDDATIEKLRIQLNTDPDVSPYEEIKRKNRQLVELAEKLKESEQLYRDLADSLPLLIYSVNINGQLIYANKWLQEYIGMSAEELNELKWKDVIHPDDYEPVMQGWQANEKNKSFEPVQRRLRDARTGEYRWHTGIATLMPHEDHALSYWNTYMVDIHAQKIIEQTLKDNSELKETQKKLEQKIAELHSSNQQLEQFAYVASHDLQEPLRKIGFYSDYLKNHYQHLLEDRGSLFLSNILNATERMKLLISDVLTFSVINNREENFAPSDLNMVVREAIQDLEISIEEKNATFNISQLPIIEGIPHQLRQLFENLFSNAIKYSDAMRPPVITVTTTPNGSDHVSISVKDNGIGFEMIYFNKMFSLFQRLHSRDQYTGTGIGLPICKKIVDIHKGTISAESHPDQGATFTITLPLKQSIA